MDRNEHAIVLFDGVCNFCNGTVNFLIDRDKNDQFRFAALQSETGERLTAEHSIDRNETDSVVLIDQGRAYFYSEAALRIGKRLGGIWSLGYAFIILPSTIRDFFYKLFAKHRYRLFGKADSCRIPKPEEAQKFI
ncbi:MAG: thiol-disulfide oxidoreductase DCC family protein [Pyrinomonadaceae bacterium]|nr:thiol-disulfide oxidoreductase DCC family protein [Pyrinomonadaceae bacterium]